MCHKRVGPALVVHIEVVGPKPCEEPEKPTENRDGWWTGRGRLVGTDCRLNLRETFGYTASVSSNRNAGALVVWSCSSTARITRRAENGLAEAGTTYSTASREWVPSR